MGTGQTLITLGAMVLLSFVVMNLNRHLSTNDISLAQNRYRLEALSLLTSYIEQTSQYFFDEASTDTSSEKNLSDFATPGNLGFDSNDNGEIDDFDDFNNYAIIDTGRSGVRYHIAFEVDYVKLQGNQILTSSSREYHKRMKISVTDDYSDPLLYRWQGGQKIKDTLRVSFVQSYWFYN